MSKIKIEYIDPKELHLNDENINIHPRESIEKIKTSIKSYGFKNPILIDKDNIVIAGNGRLQAALELELKEVPIIKIDDLNPIQLKAFAVADNATKEFSFFDEELLAGLIDELKDEDFDIDLLCLDDHYIDDWEPEEGLVPPPKDDTDKDTEKIIIECKKDDKESLKERLEIFIHEQGFVNVKIS